MSIWAVEYAIRLRFEVDNGEFISEVVICGVVESIKSCKKLS